MLTGLTSVTFRKLSPPEIVRITKEAGLDGIEWGGDVHCPPGDEQAAREVAALMRESGLATISYGSYYRVGSFGPFDQVLATAVALDAPNIRVWAGDAGSAQAQPDAWAAVVKDSQRCADMAAAHDVEVSYEYHANTLTDTLATTERLLSEANRGNIFSYWQPPAGLTAEDNVHSIRRLIAMGKLKNLHVFSWEGAERMPLAHGREIWETYIREASAVSPALLLEFVRGEEPAQMAQDAQTLRALRDIVLGGEALR